MIIRSSVSGMTLCSFQRLPNLLAAFRCTSPTAPASRLWALGVVDNGREYSPIIVLLTPQLCDILSMSLHSIIIR